MHVVDRHHTGYDAREQVRSPAGASSCGQPQDHKENQSQAEAEQRRALGDEVSQHRIQPLEVQLAIEGVLPRQMKERRDAAVLDVAQQEIEAEAAAQEEDKHRDRGGSPSAGEAQRGEIEHGWEGKAEQAGGHHEG